MEFTEREREKKNYVRSVINNYIASQKQIGIPVASMCFPSSQSSMYISGAQADEFCTGLHTLFQYCNINHLVPTLVVLFKKKIDIHEKEEKLVSSNSVT